MIINKNVISKLKPCKDRFDNYIKEYGNKDFTPAQFMGLKRITQQDKMWVAFRLMPKDNIRLAAADIAESVLHIYEEKYSEDNRPRKAIEAARSGDKDAATYATYAAYVAANAAYAAIASYAAYDAAYAALAAYDAARTATYAASAYTGKDRNVQEKLIRKICLRYLK